MSEDFSPVVIELQPEDALVVQFPLGLDDPDALARISQWLHEVFPGRRCAVINHGELHVVRETAT